MRFRERAAAAIGTACATAFAVGCLAPSESVRAYAPPALAEPAEVFALTCAHCHASGLEAAPQAGVPADWNARETRDVDVLVERVIAGRGHMPPLGSCSWCTRNQIRGVLAMMLAGSDITSDIAAPDNTPDNTPDIAPEGAQ